jgi:hypothetical protein
MPGLFTGRMPADGRMMGDGAEERNGARSGEIADEWPNGFPTSGRDDCGFGPIENLDLRLVLLWPLDINWRRSFNLAE